MKEDLNNHKREEQEMVTYPFKRNKKQKIWSIVVIIICLILILVNPFLFSLSRIKVNGFIIGFILGLISLVYLFDSL